MTTSMIISTILECAVGLFLIWGVFNEDKLCDFEDMVWEAAKRAVARKKVAGSQANLLRKEA